MPYTVDAWIKRFVDVMNELETGNVNDSEYLEILDSVIDTMQARFSVKMQEMKAHA